MPHRKNQSTCEICYKTLKKKIEIVNSIQPKTVCYNCWYTYLKTSISDQYYQPGAPINSPINEQTFNPEDCLQSLRTHHRQTLQELMMKKYVSRTKDIGQCPSSTCKYAFIESKCRKKEICPACDKPLALKNGFSIWSWTSKIHLSLMNKCPDCQMTVQKISGCPHMTCTCSHEFCWYCFHDFYYYKQKVYTNHDHTDCGFITVSKFVFFFICIMGVLLNYSPDYNINWLFGHIPTFLLFILKTILIDIFIFIQIINIKANVEDAMRNRRFGLNYKGHFILMFIIMALSCGLLWLFSYFQVLYPILKFGLFTLIFQGVAAGIIALLIFIFDR